MKKALLLLSVLLLSASCVDLNGVLEVKETFNVQKKGGFLNLQTKKAKLQPGRYTAELKAITSKNLKLKLKGGSLGELDIPIRSEEDLNIPFSGKFFIEGKKISQPFNVSGEINTEIDHYGYTDSIERCERTFQERRCEKVCVRETGKCDVVCKEVTVTVQGLKEVSYHYKRTDRKAILDFMPDNSTAIVASLPVSGIEIDKVIDRESLCR